MTIPSVSTNALGYGAFLGLYANLRYQLLCGFDKAMVQHFDVIGVALVFSTALRYVDFSLLNCHLRNLSLVCFLVCSYLHIKKFCLFGGYAYAFVFACIVFVYIHLVK